MGRLDETHWQTVKWTSNGGDLRRGFTLTLASDIRSLVGAGGTDTIADAAFQSPRLTHLPTLGRETYHLNDRTAAH